MIHLRRPDHASTACGCFELHSASRGSSPLKYVRPEDMVPVDRWPEVECGTCKRTRAYRRAQKKHPQHQMEETMIHQLLDGWKHLESLTDGRGEVTRLMAAKSIDGIGCIAVWERQGEAWTLWAVDTEKGEWCADDPEESGVPLSPPIAPQHGPDTDTEPSARRRREAHALRQLVAEHLLSQSGPAVRHLAQSIGLHADSARKWRSADVVRWLIARPEDLRDAVLGRTGISQQVLQRATSRLARAQPGWLDRGPNENSLMRWLRVVADLCWQAEKQHGVSGGKATSSAIHNLRPVIIELFPDGPEPDDSAPTLSDRVVQELDQLPHLDPDEREQLEAVLAEILIQRSHDTLVGRWADAIGAVRFFAHRLNDARTGATDAG